MDILKIISYLIVFLPFLSFCLIGARVNTPNMHFEKYVSVLCVMIACIFSIIIFYNVVSSSKVIHHQLLEWLALKSCKIYWSIYIDTLTALMLVIVTSISCLVHIYSIGYMSHDKSFNRFMAYLSLFTFFMLILVVSDNFLQLFVGWEGVGLSSFLLIGFWFEKKSAANAAFKAFIVNRVGDIGLIIAVILIYLSFGTLEYNTIFSQLPTTLDKFLIFGVELSTIDIICISMFIGCIGKSAQLGLHVWLPDAMEGPTPVSALIHAATMVTAGVFLLARCSFLVEQSPITLSIIVIIGAITCLFAATIALVQSDIKKIIAYSTCSQLGYMVFACGLSFYTSAIFHLFTHAFFKALLFLGAGSVIHAMHDEQNIFNMGNLKRHLPFTYVMMFIGSWALSGLPPFAGYFSKDLILEDALSVNNVLGNFSYSIGLFVAFLTSVYSWRLFFIVFHGNSMVSAKVLQKGIHESGVAMNIPLSILSIGAIFAGYIWVNHFGISNVNFWNKSIAQFHIDGHVYHKVFDYLPIFVSGLGLALSYIFYCIKPHKTLFSWFKIPKKLYDLLINKYYIDQFYDTCFARSTRVLSSFFWKFVDNLIIDSIPSFPAKFFCFFSQKAKYLQGGQIAFYSTFMLLGVVFAIYYILYLV